MEDNKGTVQVTLQVPEAVVEAAVGIAGRFMAMKEKQLEMGCKGQDWLLATMTDCIKSAKEYGALLAARYMAESALSEDKGPRPRPKPSVV